MKRERGELVYETAVLWGGAVGLFALGLWLFHLHASAPAGGSFQGDLRRHLELAAQVEEGIATSLTLPHPGFHYLVIFVSRLTGGGLEAAAIVLMALATVASYVLTFRMLAAFVGPGVRRVHLAALALMLSLVGPLYAPFFNRTLYLGQGTPNIWHSPTWIVMQPFALLTFWWTVTFPCLAGRAGWRRMAGASLALLLSALLKPSFAVVFVPALALFLIGRAKGLRDRFFELGRAAMVAAPTLLLLGFQYAYYYATPSHSGAKLVVAPFLVWGAKTPSVAVSALLTLAFPLVVTAVWPRALVEDPGIRLAWIMTTIAFLERALLADVGPFLMAGNWAWGYFISLKLIFVSSLTILLGRGGAGGARYRVSSWLCGLCWAVLGLHFITGLFYLWRLLSGRGFE